jgi:hypothetical protein
MGEHDVSEYDVKYLSRLEINGKLLLYPDKVVFSPEEEYAEKIEIPVAKITDARFATKNDISALRVWLVGPVLGTLWKKQHKILVIDFNDEFGIIQHLTFEGEYMEEAIEELYDIRKRKKSGLDKKAKIEPTLKIPKYANWQCPRCLRMNSPKARFCTRCSFYRKKSQ